MSFTGPDPYGTSGGIDLFAKPQIPQDIRKGEGRTFFAFLRVNGVLTEKNRENVEDVIRVLGIRGESLIGFLIRQSGTVIDPSASDIDFIEVINPVNDGSGGVDVSIIPASLLTVMFADDQITLAKFANNAVGTTELIDLSVITGKIVDGNVTGVKQSGADCLSNIGVFPTQNAIAGAGVFTFATTTIVLPASPLYDVYAEAAIQNFGTASATTNTFLSLSDGTTSIQDFIARSPASSLRLYNKHQLKMNQKQNVTMTATINFTGVAGNTATIEGAWVRILAIPRI